MKLVLFKNKEEGQLLLDKINEYLGSTYAYLIETDEGWAVPLTPISTSNKVVDLESMVVGKEFVPPAVDTPPTEESPTLFFKEAL